MHKDSAITPIMRHAAIIPVLFLCALLSGCGGSHAEYALADNPWIGKRVTFERPMVYMSNLPAGYSDKEVIRIGRELMLSEEAAYNVRAIRKMEAIGITSIPAGTTFDIIAVFTIVHDGYTRLFASDYDVLVLKDGHGTLSTMLLSAYQDYERERARGLTGVRKD